METDTQMLIVNFFGTIGILAVNKWIHTLTVNITDGFQSAYIRASTAFVSAICSHYTFNSQYSLLSAMLNIGYLYINTF